VISAGKTMYVARSNIYTESGKLAAAGQGTYIVTKILLTSLDGYND
jgi:acyl-coenzyme A thioesterase PaaI-like protein